MCVKEIERRGLCSEGIYRVSGLRDDVEALRVTFDRGKQAQQIVFLVIVIIEIF